MSVGQALKRVALTKTVEWAIGYLEKDPERNVKKVVEILYNASNTFNLPPVFKDQLKGVKTLVDNNRPGAQLLINLLKDTNPEVAKKLAVNFIVNAAWWGVPIQRETTKKEGFNVPWFMLVDPTERCNYNCIGCWAGSY
ncbi:MAG: radical SAM protein, partial [Caldisericum sp.]